MVNPEGTREAPTSRVPSHYKARPQKSQGRDFMKYVAIAVICAVVYTAVKTIIDRISND